MRARRLVPLTQPIYIRRMILASRTALVTGGGRGIGRAIAELLASQGARVVVTGRTVAELDEVARRIDGVAIEVDLADRGRVLALPAQVSARVGRVDILINNAGVAESAPLSRTTDEMLDRALAINTVAPILLARAFLPAMIDAGWGRIVNVASNAGLTGYAYTTAYCASKHALVGFTRALAMEIATTGVTVNAVCPGFVDTRITDEAAALIAGKTKRTVAESKSSLASMSPQKRLMQPEEIAHAVMTLLHDHARGIHGQAIAIDGGQVMT